ncbi:alpha/beta fold hydrolase [[Phormidium] sp. ETS-05]|uniref:alpha/beta fold hydrolase n=1 Tax=[Phormidium] sp. ETS-05 TaxID=222819 RepID=UPI0018EEDDE9|nr:alpha/beta hydrolase [[Phormidium] sp. ETS-05]
MPYIQVGGTPHYYQWLDPTAPTKDKPVMAFVHGWGGSARYWETTAAHLSKDFDCLLYDLRGFGRSRLLENPIEFDWEMESYAADLAALLDALQLDRVYLNSHSMGASVAVVFANRYPERVEKLILTCSGIFEYDEKTFSAFHKWGSLVVQFRPQWLSRIPLMERFFMARFLHRPIPTAAQRAFLEDYLMADDRAVRHTIFTSVSQKATEVMPEEFARLQVPTLLVSGEHDQIIPAAGGRQAAQLNQMVEFVEIPATSHFPMLEDPDSYLHEVIQFLGVGS